jgi:hypothetical protein
MMGVRYHKEGFTVGFVVTSGSLASMVVDLPGVVASWVSNTVGATYECFPKGSEERTVVLRLGLPASPVAEEKIYETKKGKSRDDCYDRSDGLDGRPSCCGIGDLENGVRQGRVKAITFPYLLRLSRYRTSGHWARRKPTQVCLDLDRQPTTYSDW